MPKGATINRLLDEYSQGDPEALKSIAPLVYGELRKMARTYFRSERPEHTLQPTALVHEVFLKLLEAKSIHLQHRQHFLYLAAQMMRRILVNYAQGKNRLKRSGGLRVTFNEEIHVGEMGESALLQLDEALTRLAESRPRQAQVVELRYFGGLSIEETAEVLNSSPATIKRDWIFAKTWLYRDITKTK
jgi:RNA polymerase sigma factor (TIGR02999 family)